MVWPQEDTCIRGVAEQTQTQAGQGEVREVGWGMDAMDIGRDRELEKLRKGEIEDNMGPGERAGSGEGQGGETRGSRGEKDRNWKTLQMGLWPGKESETNSDSAMQRRCFAARMLTPSCSLRRLRQRLRPLLAPQAPRFASAGSPHTPRSLTPYLPERLLLFTLGMRLIAQLRRPP